MLPTFLNLHFSFCSKSLRKHFWILYGHKNCGYVRSQIVAMWGHTSNLILFGLLVSMFIKLNIYPITNLLLSCRKSVKGNTALHDCAESGSLEIMKLLIQSGARIDVDAYGEILTNMFQHFFCPALQTRQSEKVKVMRHY